jgi:hypothetical protein
MGLTPAQFKDRTGLLDIVVAYHIIPGDLGTAVTSGCTLSV